MKFSASTAGKSDERDATMLKISQSVCINSYLSALSADWFLENSTVGQCDGLIAFTRTGL
jgi:hypothetical protein